YCAVAYAVFSTSPCYAQIVHVMTFQNSSGGRHIREITGQQTQDDQSIGVSLNTSDERTTTHSSSTVNGVTQDQTYTYINKAKSQAVETGHRRRIERTQLFEAYDYSDYAVDHTVDFSF
ncbi:hypothetical protein ACSYAD_35960, partial [Acaryochloris marina NIES-2412]